MRRFILAFTLLALAACETTSDAKPKIDLIAKPATADQKAFATLCLGPIDCLAAPVYTKIQMFAISATSDLKSGMIDVMDAQDVLIQVRFFIERLDDAVLSGDTETIRRIGSEVAEARLNYKMKVTK